MDEANIAATQPCVIEVEAGDHWWCACGLSSNQPFCDGSHKGTKFVPEKAHIPEKQRIAWCACKRSGNGPFCDGSHKGLG